MNREWNLVFGVLAVQLEKAGPAQMAAIAAAWAEDPAVDLPARLVQAGALTESDRRLVAALADLAVQMHGGDAADALAAFGGEEQARKTFSGAGAGASSGTAVQLVRGQTLREALANAHTLTERLHLIPAFAGLCDLAAGAHAQGAANGNLHPGAVIIGEFGEVVLRDWGQWAARRKRDLTEDPATEAGGAAATNESQPPDEMEIDPRYRAPEMQSKRAKADPRGDVFSLGAILYEILTGHAPFVWKEAESGRSDTRVLERVAVLEPSAPDELVRICERCIRRDAAARYAAAGPVADGLRRFLLGSQTAAEAEPAPSDSGVWKGLFLAAVTAFVIVLLGGVFAYRSAAHNRDQALVALDDQKGLSESGKQRADEDVKDLRAKLVEAENMMEQYNRMRQSAETARVDAEKALAETKRQLAAKQQQAQIPVAVTADGKPAPEADAKPPAPEEPKPADKAEFKPKYDVPLPPEPEPAAPPAVAPPPPPLPQAKPAVQPPAPEKTDLRPAGLTRAELIAALPDLSASLKMEKQPDGKSAVVVRAPDPKKAPGVTKLGLKDGDVITRINRNPVDTLDQAHRILGNVNNEPGFSVRIVRGGQSGWMRITYTDGAPNNQPAKDAEPPAAQKQEPEPQNAEPATEEPPATDAAPAQEEPEEEPAEQNP